MPNGPQHVLIDSTGLKVYGAGEWLVEKPYGAQLPGARALCQLHAVAPIGLDTLAGTPRNLRRGNDLADQARLQGTLQPETVRPASYTMCRCSAVPALASTFSSL